MSVISDIDKSKLPVHVGIIMDGNGRWAKERGKPRTAGHTEGLKAAKRIVKAASDLGIRYITLYTFSTENWRRTEKEIKFLLRLIAKHLRKEWDFYYQNHVRVKHSGDLNGLPAFVRKEISDVTSKTAGFNGTTVNLAINYGGRDEIMRSVRKILSENTESTAVDEKLIRSYFDNADMPDPDLIIRTGGQIRLSNFLTWESAYSELYFCSKYWPDYEAEDFYAAVFDFQHRKRNFGGR